MKIFSYTHTSGKIKKTLVCPISRYTFRNNILHFEIDIILFTFYKIPEEKLKKFSAFS